MARKAVVILEDDLTGQLLEPGSGESITFALDGQTYEIDLTDEHVTELRQALRRYTDAARTTSGATGRRAGQARRQSSPQRRPDSGTIRAWARENGHTVPDRGRIPNTVLAAYTAAH